MRFLIVILGLVGVCLSGCAPEPTYYEVTGRLHTPYHIKFQYTESLEEEIAAQLDYFYHLFNAFDSTSVISRVNRGEPVEVDTLFQKVFNRAQEVAALTDGAYDITCAPLINLWGFGFKDGDTVTAAAIDSVRAFIGYEKVHLEGNRVVKADPRVILNMSSIADGTVCDMIAAMFESKGIQNYMVEFGGEMRVKGLNHSGEAWRLGITKRTDDSTGLNQELQQIIRFPMPRGMATSGNYRNFYVKDGKKYAHTIDPIEGCPVQRDILSATIVAADGMTAAACATAFMVLGSERAKRFYERMKGIDYYIICADSTGQGFKVEYSPGFRQYLLEK